MAHEFRGQRNRRARKKGGFSQAHTRRHQYSYDQHGRKWFANVGTKTGLPIGMIEATFQAPWIPDQQYIKINRENPSELYIDYEAMLTRRKAVLQAYHNLAEEFARLEKLEIPKFGEYSEIIIKRLGNPPRAIQPVIAAIQDNTYILGKTYAKERGLPYREDPRLTRFVKRQTIVEKLLMDFDFSDDTTSASSYDAVRARNEAERARRVNRAKDLLLQDAPFDMPPDELDALRKLPVEEIQAKLIELRQRTAVEGFDATEVTDETTDALLGSEDEVEAIEEEHDPQAIGGRTLSPAEEARLAGEVPEQNPGARGLTSRQAERRESRNRRGDNRPSLAQGAVPRIASED
jgi:hypothetical protein